MATATASAAATTAGAATAAAANPSSFASASLYVGDLAPDVTEALLFEIFNAVGPVASVRVCRDAATRRSLGYAYVNFHRVEDAERALDTMNFKPIRNRQCRIMWSHRDPSLRRSGAGNIFVNHLEKSIDTKQLHDTFSMFGDILSCKIATNSKRESLGYGFVHFYSEKSAQDAISRVDGKVISGHKVSVSLFKSKKERGGNNQFKYTNVFVKNLPVDTTKEALDKMFSEFGTVTSSMVTADKDTVVAGGARAFGFVNFAAPEEATAAVEALNGKEVGGKPLYVARAQKKEEREKELRERFEQVKNERQKKYAGVNLYVKNLSEEVDDERLSTEFSKFGSITSAKVMRDAPNAATPGKSRGFGFVCFSTPEEATKAVTEMNGRMLDGKPLYVALAQRKEIRRAQLEAQYTQRAKLGLPGPGGAGGVGAGGMGGPIPQMGYPIPPQMFQGMPPQNRANFMFPQQQVMPRWAPGANPAIMGGMNVRSPYQLMPVGNPRVGVPNGAAAAGGNPQQNRVGGGNGGNPAAGNRNGPRNPRNGPAAAGAGGVAGAKPANFPGAPQQAGAGGQNIRYTDNVRNRGAAPANMMGGASNAPVAQENVVMPAAHEPLTIKALAAAPEEMRKQMIGERLFPLIQLQEPQLAGKITGMLLEMDNGELIHLLESAPALNEKIAEALAVLQSNTEPEEK